MARPSKKRRTLASVDRRRLRRDATYTIPELAEALGVSVPTVRNWRRKGLEPIDDNVPLLFHGAAVKDWLDLARASRRSRCGPSQFYCFSCRVPRVAESGSLRVLQATSRTLRLAGFCHHCGGRMSRNFAAAAGRALFARQGQSDLAVSGSPHLEEQSARGPK
ncbi:helix-turn-helix domain-containing protein [Aurantimonas sp. E1-2-R+4]|uniref:helix-turn-helix domain-containing protein n=1 Tax=Aurantimonas sp. E1-2-R+4 TaxID=3113714 RepID=UPI003FA547C4